MAADTGDRIKARAAGRKIQEHGKPTRRVVAGAAVPVEHVKSMDAVQIAAPAHPIGKRNIGTGAKIAVTVRAISRIAAFTLDTVAGDIPGL